MVYFVMYILSGIFCLENFVWYILSEKFCLVHIVFFYFVRVHIVLYKCPVHFVWVCFVCVHLVSYILSGIFCPVYFVRYTLPGKLYGHVLSSIMCPLFFYTDIFCPGIFCPSIYCPGLFCPGIFYPNTGRCVHCVEYSCPTKWQYHSSLANERAIKYQINHNRKFSHDNTAFIRWGAYSPL